ncbi:fibronectin type III domain protein [Tahibacter aquaticus]|uniref:Fibronectin type III domain protein n=1 Tax=Tahibacter aquaticus TaxID=520092 RepID=A0A4R6Z4W8_9GAMM|nr:fibronectin type III domain-containing protein [Tahibacter aquaticus]TDR46722.1 fibronectin type III domain protein [Tahibacter aquaticus]
MPSSLFLRRAAALFVLLGCALPSAAATAGATVPPAPTVTSVVPGNGKVTVGYSLSGDGGSAIQGIIINCGDVTVFGGNNPLPVNGLANGVTVTCRVRARNGIGDGPWSADSAPVTPAGPPAALADVVATRGNGQVSVAFVPGDDGGLPATYNAQCGTQSISGAASPLLVTGLVNGVSVTCEAWATNSVGAGPHTAAAAVTPATVPDAPVITGVVRGNQQVTVTFTAPASNGGDPVQGYLPTCGDQTVFGGNLSLPVGNLANGVAVTCTVRALNGVGNSAASAPSEPVTPATVPGAPSLTGVVSGDSSAQLNFTAPADNGGASVSSYRADCTPGTHNSSGAASPLTVAGLSNGETYTCIVVATNAVGSGPAAAGLSVVPRLVADLGVSIDNGQHFIAGGSQTSYLIDVHNGSSRAIFGVRVNDVPGAQFSDVSWICSADSGGSCPASGSGGIDALVDLAPNAGVSFLLSATVAALPEVPSSNSVTIIAPNSVADPVAANDSATDGPDGVGLFADGFD